MARSSAVSVTAQHYCGRCSQSFNSRKALNKHLQNHPDGESATLACTVCNWPFADSLALEDHCRVNGHLQTATPQQSAKLHCDRCSDTFVTKREYKRHREHGRPCYNAFHTSDWKKSLRPGHTDPDKPTPVFEQVPDLACGGELTEKPADVSDDGVYCHDCTKDFASKASYIRHALSCCQLYSKPATDSPPETLGAPGSAQYQGPAVASPTTMRRTVTTEAPAPRGTEPTTLADGSLLVPRQIAIPNVRPPVSRGLLPISNAPNGSSSAKSPVILEPSHASTYPQASFSSPKNSAPFICNVSGCQRSYNSEPGLKMHQADAHGVGGQGLDLHGRDSWMLSQQERERLRTEGISMGPKGPNRGHGGHRNSRRGGRAASDSASPASMRAPLPAASVQQRAPNTQSIYGQVPPRNTSRNAPLPLLPTSQSIDGALEMEQAKSVCGKTLRLLLQTDVLIQHDGKIGVSGMKWTRIRVERQPAIVGMFDNMCHLPRKLQPLEYVPVPKTFTAEYTAQYPVIEFDSAPDRSPAKPGLGIIAMACSKIVLSNGHKEVVKIAAVDLLTCRILMSHLVCTDPKVRVSDWCSSVTGLRSFKDMEDARQAGYKVFKGWAAARSALFKFIDKDTIIVGHNLRSELDALRIIHGRAVDIAKVIEKAAQGPLSKAQVSLDSWCRDVANVAKLKTDPVFGRDCVTSAFAAREIGLWAIKNREQFEEGAKRKTKEYQLV